MNLEKISKDGTTNRRKSFWDSIADVVLLCRKIKGTNVTVDEHRGFGTVINAARNRGTTGCVHIDTVTIVNPGHDYHVGTFLLPSESPPFGVLCPPADDFAFRLIIDAVDGAGAVTAFTITGGLVYPYPGLGMTIPFNNPVHFGDSGGFGLGFTANCTWA